VEELIDINELWDAAVDAALEMHRTAEDALDGTEAEQDGTLENSVLGTMQEGTQKLAAFINAHIGNGAPTPPDVELVSELVSIMAFMLHENYPDEDVRSLFAAFSQALFCYGYLLGNGGVETQ
jgi:hypothetical protein